VLDALVTDLGDGTLTYHAGVTLYRALIGFLLAALAGIPFAAAMARSTLVRNLFEPIFFFGYPVPKIALFPVFTYVFGIGTPSKIAFTFLECLYPIVVTCYFGFRAVETRLIWSAENCAAGRVAKYLRRLADRAAGRAHRRRDHGDDRRFRRARLLHHHLEHALQLRQRLRGDYRHRALWTRARSEHAVAPPARCLLAAGGDVMPGDDA
jgi:hypothetical protein